MSDYYFVKVPLFFVKAVTSQCVFPLYINHEVLHFKQSLLGLLQRGTFGVDSLNLLLSLLQTLSKLFPDKAIDLSQRM